MQQIGKSKSLKPWYVDFHDSSQWPWFVNPGVILMLYITLAVECRHWLHRKVIYIMKSYVPWPDYINKNDLHLRIYL
jgi:hypothetical protein